MWSCIIAALFQSWLVYKNDPGDGIQSDLYSLKNEPLHTSIYSLLLHILITTAAGHGSPFDGE